MKLSKAALLIYVSLSLVLSAVAEESYLLTAADAGARAVRYDTSLQSAYTDLRLQYAALGLDLRSFFPALAFDFGSNDTTHVQDADSRLMTISATLTQPLWDGGKALAGYTQKKMELEQLLRKLDRQAREIREKAIELFYSALISEKKLQLKNRMLALAEEQLSLMKREVSLGVTTEMEYRKAEGTYRTLMLEKKSLEIDTKLERLQLGRMTHLYEAFLLDDSVVESLYMAELPFELLYARALRNNQELADVAWRIQRLQAEIKAKSWSFIPAVSLVAVFSTSTDQLPFSEYTWSVGLQLGFSGELFSMNTGIRYSKTSSNDKESIEQSGSGVPLQDLSAFLSPSYYANALKEAVLEMESLRKDVRTSVEEALERYKLAMEQKKLEMATVSLAQEQYELVLVQKQLGLAKQIDVMNAALAVEEKNLDSIDADYTVLRAEREIEKLVMFAPGQLRSLLSGE